MVEGVAEGVRNHINQLIDDLLPKDDLTVVPGCVWCGKVVKEVGMGGHRGSCPAKPSGWGTPGSAGLVSGMGTAPGPRALESSPPSLAVCERLALFAGILGGSRTAWRRFADGLDSSPASTAVRRRLGLFACILGGSRMSSTYVRAHEVH